eukprot:scaffold539_cov359-Prasinococcus_capsulatus_cf.AAC.32
MSTRGRSSPSPATTTAILSGQRTRGVARSSSSRKHSRAAIPPAAANPACKRAPFGERLAMARSKQTGYTNLESQFLDVEAQAGPASDFSYEFMDKQVRGTSALRPPQVQAKR